MLIAISVKRIGVKRDSTKLLLNLRDVICITLYLFTRKKTLHFTLSYHIVQKRVSE